MWRSTITISHYRARTHVNGRGPYQIHAANRVNNGPVDEDIVARLDHLAPERKVKEPNVIPITDLSIPHRAEPPRDVDERREADRNAAFENMSRFVAIRPDTGLEGCRPVYVLS
ncbi:hypothetical protein EVAR_97849_1 [Eumeta japonica]|uniref:Uncharacterized protein n=1 Tax=Eumeta variegata TaxID=151549 RepID=A0A4C1WWB6_EUMVA|nr:hypothetical protein EVAR_97849_1 [Eumeta japonica]